MARIGRLILVRHGESQWNRDNRFTGWADVDLTTEGVQQMRRAAAALLDAGINIDCAYSSVLRRCIRSQWILVEGLDRMWVPQVLDWRLNERHYGGLTGQSKVEAIDTHGEAAVLRWRRSYDAVPPPLDNAASNCIPLDGRYADVAPASLPTAESLQQTVRRVSEVWGDSLASALRAGRTIAVTAHGNSLRALIKVVEQMSDEDVAGLEVFNGEPVVYELDDALRPIDKRVLGNSAFRRPSGIL